MGNVPVNDLELVRRCTEKDTSAWDEFLRKYPKLIYNYIHSVLRTKGKDLPSDTIADLYQEIIFSLIKDNYKKLKTFKAKNGCSLASWLRVVTINFTIDYIRKSKPAVSLDEDLGEGRGLKDVLPDDSHLKLEEEIVSQEKKEQLSECIEELSVDDQYFLRFYLDKGVALDKLKVILRISKPAVDMRRSRIIQRLKECFERRGFLLGY